MLALARRHGGSLQNLSLRARKGHWSSLCTIEGLLSLQMEFFLTANTTARLVYKNRKTLQHLGIGLESRILEGFYNDGLNVEEKNISDSETFTVALREFDEDAESQAPMLQLQSLKMIGLDLRLMLYGHSLLDGESTMRPIIDLQHLNSLSLESCLYLGTLLPLLAQTSSDGDSVNNLPNLRSLTIRSERTHRLRSRSLASFLCALSPLKTLRILFSGGGVLPKLSDILLIHGATLETLVWEDRLGQREDLESDRLPLDEECDIEDRASDIAEYCPNLVELGIAVEWCYNRDGVPTGFDEDVRLF